MGTVLTYMQVGTFLTYMQVGTVLTYMQAGTVLTYMQMGTVLTYMQSGDGSHIYAMRGQFSQYICENCPQQHTHVIKVRSVPTFTPLSFYYSDITGGGRYCNAATAVPNRAVKHMLIIIAGFSYGNRKVGIDFSRTGLTCQLKSG